MAGTSETAAATHMPDSEGFGDRLRNIRLARGLTQRQLADQAGVSMDAVKSWEGHRRHPRDEQLFALARTLEVTGLWLLKGIDL